MNSAHIYTDGSCLGNPGPGGWAYLIEFLNGDFLKEEGGEPETTNNRMELRAVVEALTTLFSKHPEVQNITVFSDSSWVVNTMTQNWKRRKNKDLWIQLDTLISTYKGSLAWEWVKGHAGHPQNEDCDLRAQKAARLQLRQPKRQSTLF